MLSVKSAALPDPPPTAAGTPEWGSRYARAVERELPFRPERERPFPIVLQQHARVIVRKHVSRGLIRALALLASDVAIIFVLRLLFRGVRDAAWFGAHVAGVAGELMPRGAFSSLEFIGALVCGLWVVGAYGQGNRRHDAEVLLVGTTLGLTLFFWGRLWSQFSAYSVVDFALAAGVVGFAVVLERSAVHTLASRLRTRGRHVARVLVIGTPDDARRAIDRLPPGDPSTVVGSLNTGPESDPGALGGLSDLIWVIERYLVDTVVLCSGLAEELSSDLLNIADAAGCQVFTMLGSVTAAGFEPRVVWRRGTPIVQLTRPSLRGGQLALKRAVDITAALCGLVLLAPLYLAIAIAVRVSSPGGIIFRQTRVGSGGRKFDILKFRSMTCDAEERRVELLSKNVYSDARLFKLSHDPRITKLGAILRRTSLDELPQLWNVLRGDMSLVGPRPPLPSEVALYEEHQYARFDMKPGITGPWQVSGRNRITDFQQVIRLETAYMRRWSLLKDFAILARTVPALLKMDGAQ